MTAPEIPSRACGRRHCDWESGPTAVFGPPLQQAVEHARTSGHALCQRCHRSLTDVEDLTCERCISRALVALRGIVELYALLPEQMGHPATQVYNRSGGGDDLPLPGGQALVMLGPGGQGNKGRRLTPGELAAGLEPQLDGREHMSDNKAEDGLSVVSVLADWEDEWRRSRAEPPAQDALRVAVDQWWLPGGLVGPLTTDAMRRLAIARALAGPSAIERTVLAATGYLERRMRWAATSRDDFPDFYADLQRTVTALRHATSTGEDPLRAAAPCLDCGRRTLERRYRRPDACECERPPATVPDGPEPKYLRLAQHRRQLELWEAAHEQTCDQGGLVERWTCSHCDREYSEKEYLLAQADWMRKLATAQPDDWLRPNVVALMLQTTPKAIRHWIERGQVGAMCDVVTHRVFVWWPDARDRVFTPRRRRRAAS